MRNTIICIGADDYSHLTKLSGAEGDCNRVYEALASSGLYDRGASKLLLSPTLDDVRSCLDGVASYKDLGVLTFYFAGHGGIKSGTFYLCFRDTNSEKLSTTSLPILDLFTVIGEVQPRQANFVVDACQSAGAMFDLNALMKPEIIGRAGSCSIAFLAASASDQYASEMKSGGIATTAMMKYLSGEKQLQNGRPYLDLLEVGLAVSRDVVAATPDQSPVAWGLNLYGDGIFATNPHYASTQSGPAFAVDGIAPASTAGQIVRKRTEPLWGEYRAIASDHDPSRLRRTLLDMRTDLGNDYASFVRGFAPALASRASASEDLLAPSEAIGVCAISLLPCMSQPRAMEACRELIKLRAEFDHQAAAYLRRALSSDKYYLLSRGHALSDLHYLPMRVLKVLAWLSLSRLIDTVMGIDAVEAVENSNEIVRLVFEHYRECFAAVSDEQAAWTLIFGVLATVFSWNEQLAILVDSLFSTEIAVTGRVVRPGVTGKTVFYYSLARGGMGSPIIYDEIANPTELLSVLFVLGYHLGTADRWESSLRSFDGVTVNAYVPDSYSQFGEPFITGGNNFTSRLGHGVWTVEEYVAAYEKTVVPAIRGAARGLSPEASLLCGIAACVFPDRVPYLLQLRVP